MFFSGIKFFFKNFSIAKKLWLFTFTVLSILLGFFYFYFLHISHEQFKEGFLKKGTGLVQTAATNLGAGIYFSQVELLQRVLQGLENDPDLAFLIVEDMQGKKLYGYRAEQYSHLIDTLEQLKSPEEVQLFTDQFLIIKQSIFFYDEFQGYLIAGFSLDWIKNKVAEQKKNIFLLSGILFVTLLILTTLISRTISRPIQNTIVKINQYTQNNFTPRIRLPEEGSDEIAQLAISFNRLASTLETTLKKLYESKKYIETFFQLSPIPMIITDMKGNIELINNSACSFLGITEKQAHSRKLSEIINSREISEVIKRVAASASEIKGFITTIKLQSDIKKIVEINVALLRDNFNMPKSMIFVMVDITENMRTQREILQNQTQLHLMNKELRQKTSELEIAIEKNKRNARKLAQLIEISHDIIRSSTVHDVLKILTERGANLLEAEACVIFLWDPASKNLKPMKSNPSDLLKKIQPIQAGDGVVWKTYSENKSYFINEESLTASDFQVLGLTSNSSVSIISIPLSEKDYKFGVATYLNQNGNVFSLEDLHLITTLTHQAAITLDKIYLLQALREKAQHLEKAYKDLQHSQQQILQLQKMESLGTLVGGIAHDFNNILGIITPNVDLIRLKAQNDPQIMKRVLIINEAIERATDLTRQLLMFSKDQDVRLEPISPNQLIMRLAGMFRRTLGKHIEVIADLEPGVPFIKGDETRLTQVLINLAVNARDAMPNGGKLILKTSVVKYMPNDSKTKSPQPFVRIQVTDTGVGIPADHLDKIFDPFFTTKSVGQGTGLGLSVVYGIVKSHNGYIEVESKPNQGTTFSIYFSPIKEMPKPKDEGEMQWVPMGHENILVVDDEEMIRDSIRDILQSLGYNVFLAEGGMEAIQIVQEKHNIHLAIVDYAMPRMNGWETIQEIRKINKNIKILLSSGHAEHEKLVQKGIEVDGFLPKPYHITDLARKIQEILHKSVLSTN